MDSPFIVGDVIRNRTPYDGEPSYLVHHVDRDGYTVCFVSGEYEWESAHRYAIAPDCLKYYVRLFHLDMKVLSEV